MIEHSDLSKPVYDRIKMMIENGDLEPGQKLVQETLADELGVSRTPLLKALQSLEHEMLVESKPRRGMYVKEISRHEMINLYCCREGLELIAVKQVIERASEQEINELADIFTPYQGKKDINVKEYYHDDIRFHDMIIELAANPVLKKMSNVSSIHKRVYSFGLIRPPEETLSEHNRIVEAICSRDISKAEVEIRNHINLSTQLLINQNS